VGPDAHPTKVAHAARAARARVSLGAMGVIIDSGSGDAERCLNGELNVGRICFLRCDRQV
jgi:hypothetical protein